MDHVIPKARGGKHVWSNVITSCKKCNHTKGNKLWEPLWKPEEPTYYDIAKSMKRSIVEVPHVSWGSYLGIELEAA